MSTRGWKWAALTISGGVLLQLGGCQLVLLEWLLNTITAELVRRVIGALTGTA